MAYSKRDVTPLLTHWIYVSLALNHRYEWCLMISLASNTNSTDYIHTCMHACIHTYINPSIHPSIHPYIHTYIHIRGFALAQRTFLLVIFAWICCDGFERQLQNGYYSKCDCLFDCNWHIGTIKWKTKIDILGWRDRGSNFRPLASRAGALSIILHLIQLIRWFHKNSI